MKYRSVLFFLPVVLKAAARERALLASSIVPGVFSLMVATAIIGCSEVQPSSGGSRHPVSADRYSGHGDQATERDIERGGRLLYGGLLKLHERGERRALRVRMDAARNRLWVLTLDHIYVYDVDGKRLVRRVTLPGWSVARFVCSPDMVLDRSGSAFISSNVQSRLWKIAAEDFAVTHHEITLRARENWDTGFGALAFAADGSLFALTAHSGSVWRIDATGSSATEVELSKPVSNACALTAPRQSIQSAQERTVTLCTAAAKDSRRIVISPDFTHGRVSNETCPS